MARPRKAYIPDTGDIVWLHLDPRVGHEQAGRRPVVVLSPASYNGKTSLMLCCPMTTQIKGYPFEVEISASRQGVALADQIKSLDWRARKATKKGNVTSEELFKIRRKTLALIGSTIA
ncbi:MAG: endoribonuclease MazF [Gammaproteobacteria bacterium]|nr:endoribonuclease MazF [Gammaproteobacteria bacterium]